MSEQRSSSAVRNLRSIFENKASDSSSPDTRGRSPNALSAKDNSRPTSKVRASFVPVEPSGMALAAEEGVGSGMAGLKRESSGLRRGSFTENDESSAALVGLKKTVSQEAERRERDVSIAEAIPEDATVSANATPNLKAMKPAEEHGASPLSKRMDVEPAHPDKPTTAAEEEPAAMQPAEPTSEAAVSGGQALPPVAEDLRKANQGTADSTAVNGRPDGEAAATKELHSAAKSARSGRQSDVKPTPNGKVPSLSTKSASKAPAPSVKSPSATGKPPRTPSSTKPAAPPAPKPVTSPPATKQPTKKASRSSLTAPTAASVARASNAERSVSTSSKQSPPTAKTKPREVTKPINLPSRLTAPTAASRAKHDAAAPPAPTFNPRASTSTKPKPQSSSARPTPRTSLQPGQRPESRSSHLSKKPALPADGSFLERMMRPTAASASKTHEKSAAPSKTSVAATKPKANGQLKKPTTQLATSRPGTSGTDKSVRSQAPSGALAQSRAVDQANQEVVLEEPIADDGPAEQSYLEPAAVEAEKPAAVPQAAEFPTDETSAKASVEAKTQPTQAEPNALDLIGIPNGSGSETPIPHTNGGTNGALEATPGFASEETIR